MPYTSHVVIMPLRIIRYNLFVDRKSEFTFYCVIYLWTSFSRHLISYSLISLCFSTNSMNSLFNLVFRGLFSLRILLSTVSMDSLKNLYPRAKKRAVYHTNKELCRIS